jgi:anti-sigma factor RsiW
MAHQAEDRARVIVNPDDLSCKELVELVTDYVEDRLPQPVRTRFEMHLSYCAPCRVYLAQMRETVNLAGRLSEETLPPGSKEALLEAFRGWKRGRGGEG